MTEYAHKNNETLVTVSTLFNIYILLEKNIKQCKSSNCTAFRKFAILCPQIWEPCTYFSLADAFIRPCLEGMWSRDAENAPISKFRAGSRIIAISEVFFRRKNKFIFKGLFLTLLNLYLLTTG